MEPRSIVKIKEEHKKNSMLEIQPINSLSKLPIKAHKGDAGWDVFTQEERSLMPGEIYAFPLGFRIIGKPGMVYKVEDKSSLSLKGLRCGGGVIDNNYRGEVHAIIQNMFNVNTVIAKGAKIAQVLVQYVSDDDLLVINNDELESTNRGEGGFGSTG